MRSTRAQALVAVGALLLVAGCGSSDDDNAAKPTAKSGPSTYQVQVDLNRADLSLPATEFGLAYYPRSLSVHQGDTVEFGLNDSGEPHTVVMGKLVDTAVTLYDKLTPAQKEGQPPAAVDAAFKKIPQLLPEGPGDAFQAGAQPCYQATGLPPTKDACAVKTGDFSGTESLVGSGWLDANKPFTLKISDNASPGTYSFFCQLHGTDMGGKLTVAAKGAPAQTPEEVKNAREALLTADTSKLASSAAAVAAATSAKPVAGAGSANFEQGAVAAFGPTNIAVPVGGAVTWEVVGPHTFFFNAPADGQQLRQPAPDGSVHLNAKAAMPIGGPGAPQKPGLFDGGSWNGVGPHSSGLIISFPPDLYSYKLRFTKAGTYNYICSVHVNMKGTVTVG